MPHDFMIPVVDIIGNVGNAIYTFGSGFKNIVLLRSSIVVAAFLEIVYSYIVAEKPLWTPILWAVALILINIYQIINILFYKYFLNFSKDELKVYELIGGKMDSLKFKKFVRMGEWEFPEEGKLIILEQVENDRLFLLVEGEASVFINEKPITQIFSGNFIGEMSFLTNEKPNSSVKVGSETKLISWRKLNLHGLLAKDKDFKHEIHSIFSNDLITKLLHHNKQAML